MSPPRSFRWSRPAAWPTWWARCRQALIEPGADVRLLLPGLPAIADAVLHQTTVLRVRAAVRRRRASRCASGRMPYSQRAGLRDRCAVALPPRRQPVPGQRRRRVARQPAALRAARLGRRPIWRRRARPRWTPQVLHAHDWHAALALRLHGMRIRRPRPASVFTVHNLAYQGLFPQRRLRAARPAGTLHVARRRWSSTASCRS